jgi:hypothetical protein
VLLPFRHGENPFCDPIKGEMTIDRRTQLTPFDYMMEDYLGCCGIICPGRAPPIMAAITVKLEFSIKAN